MSRFIQITSLLMLAGSALLAQKIAGRFDIKPAVGYADIQINIIVDGQVAAEVLASTELPFEFSVAMRPEWNGKSILFAPQVNNPDEYVVDKSRSDLIWYGSTKRIYLRRRTDVYANLQQKASSQVGVKQFASARETFSMILDNKHNLSLNDDQIFEAYMGLTAISLSERKYDEQQHYLDSLVTKVNINNLSKAKQERFAKERFNGVLKMFSYNSLNFPAVDLPVIISEDENKLLTWSNMIRDISPYYLTDSLQIITAKPKAIQAQLEKLDVVLNPQPRQN